MGRRTTNGPRERGARRELRRLGLAAGLLALAPVAAASTRIAPPLRGITAPLAARGAATNRGADPVAGQRLPARRAEAARSPQDLLEPVDGAGSPGQVEPIELVEVNGRLVAAGLAPFAQRLSDPVARVAFENLAAEYLGLPADVRLVTAEGYPLEGDGDSWIALAFLQHPSFPEGGLRLEFALSFDWARAGGWLFLARTPHCGRARAARKFDQGFAPEALPALLPRLARSLDRVRARGFDVLELRTRGRTFGHPERPVLIDLELARSRGGGEPEPRAEIESKVDPPPQAGPPRVIDVTARLPLPVDAILTPLSPGAPTRPRSNSVKKFAIDFGVEVALDQVEAADALFDGLRARLTHVQSDSSSGVLQLFATLHRPEGQWMNLALGFGHDTSGRIVDGRIGPLRVPLAALREALVVGDELARRHGEQWAVLATFPSPEDATEVGRVAILTTPEDEYALRATRGHWIELALSRGESSWREVDAREVELDSITNDAGGVLRISLSEGRDFALRLEYSIFCLTDDNWPPRARLGELEGRLVGGTTLGNGPPE